MQKYVSLIIICPLVMMLNPKRNLPLPLEAGRFIIPEFNLRNFITVSLYIG
jgi:hypothetical protein